MHGLMMKEALLASSLLSHAAENHPRTQIVSKLSSGRVHRYGYAEAEGRCKRLAKALRLLGIGNGDRVATLAWNEYRHFELFYGVTGVGAICHTLNPRLPYDQLQFIAHHAGDRMLFLDPGFVDLAQSIVRDVPSITHCVVLCDRDSMPPTILPGVISYEELLAASADDFEWPQFDELNASTLCYTSGTTGQPKGVLHSHRSLVLSAFMNCSANVFRYSSWDSICPVTPMFHGNSWGSPFGAAMAGAKLVLPGQDVSPAALFELFEAEGVTLTLGVPTVWLGLLELVESRGCGFSTLQRVLTGGTAPPLSMFQRFERLGVEVMHAWGMTEISPTGTVSLPTPELEAAGAAAVEASRLKQGRAVFGVRRKLVDDNDAAVPFDGTTPGALLVRGPVVASRYYDKPDDMNAFDADGWLRTGDIATIDRHGFMSIVDRSKDLIKSGGEWISSVELENLAMNHPDVSQAAAIGVPHPKWGERPLLVVTLQSGRLLDRQSILNHLGQHLARWQLPDAVLAVQALPLTATGKVNKVALREIYANYKPSDAGMARGQVDE